MISFFTRLRKKIKAFFISILVAIGIIVPPVLADDISLSWSNGTAFEDGTPMAIEDIQETVLYKQSFPLDGTGMADPRSYTELVRVPPTVTSYQDVNQPNGIHCYVATHVGVNGEESVLSNESCKTIDVRIPGRPNNLSAN